MFTSTFAADVAIACIIIGFVGLTMTLLYVLYATVHAYRTRKQFERELRVALHVGDLRSTLKHGRRFHR